MIHDQIEGEPFPQPLGCAVQALLYHTPSIAPRRWAGAGASASASAFASSRWTQLLSLGRRLDLSRLARRAGQEGTWLRSIRPAALLADRARWRIVDLVRPASDRVARADAETADVRCSTPAAERTEPAVAECSMAGVADGRPSDIKRLARVVRNAAARVDRAADCHLAAARLIDATSYQLFHLNDELQQICRTPIARMQALPPPLARPVRTTSTAPQLRRRSTHGPEHWSSIAGLTAEPATAARSAA